MLNALIIVSNFLFAQLASERLFFRLCAVVFHVRNKIIDVKQTNVIACARIIRSSRAVTHYLGSEVIKKLACTHYF